MADQGRAGLMLPDGPRTTARDVGRDECETVSSRNLDQGFRVSADGKSPGQTSCESESPNSRLVKSAMSTSETTAQSALDNLLDAACGKVRVARKPWRCTCADEVRQWKVLSSYTSDNGGSGCTTSTVRSEAEAHELAARKLGAVACWNVNVDPAVPSGYYDKVEVEPRRNPNYRPDCLGDIAVGDRHFEYLDDVGGYQSGTRYCARCAVAVWGRDG